MDHDDVEELLNYPDSLTEWEDDFLNSLLEWEGDFTERQEEVLERIKAKIDRKLGL